MPRYKRGRNLNDWHTNRADAGRGKLRIVGGRFRGRQIEYSGDPVTRPMKDNIREAVFNLVGGWVKGKVVLDLFAGTGAMALEALSRGAVRAFLVERHIPTVRIIEQNVQSLDPSLPAEVAGSDTFFWVRQFLKDAENFPTEPWLIFCCPPYAFFEDRETEVLEMVANLIQVAPQESIFVVESDSRFSPKNLPDPDAWTVRKYAPALVSIYRKHPSSDDLADDSLAEGSQSEQS